MVLLNNVSGLTLLSQTHYWYQSPIIKAKEKPKGAGRQFTLGTVYKGEDSKFQCMLYEDSDHSGKCITANEPFEIFEFHPEFELNMSKHSAFSILTHKNNPKVWYMVKPCCGYSLWSYIVLRLLPYSIKPNALSYFFNHVQIDFWNLFNKVYLRKGTQDSLDRGKVPVQIINPHNIVKLINESLISNIMLTDNIRKKSFVHTQHVIQSKSAILNILNMHLYNISMSSTRIFVQLTLHGASCKVSQECPLAYLLYYTENEIYAPNRTVPLHYHDFPVYIPGLRVPGTKISIISMVITTSSTCQPVNCSIDMKSYNVSSVTKQQNAVGVLYTPRCKSIHIQCQWKLWPEETHVDYRLCNMEGDPLRNLGLPTNLNYKLINVQKERFLAKVPRYFSWVEGSNICHRLNQSLPAFNSKQEIFEFIDHWYPTRENNRIYHEIAIYIDLKLKVGIF